MKAEVVKTRKFQGIQPDVPFQDASLDIWDKKYRLKDQAGNPVEETVNAMYERIAGALAEVERPRERVKWKKQFLWALQEGAIPAGRIIANAGAQEYKPATSTINCTVSETVRDSMSSILDNLRDAGMTLKSGSGIGYCFSTLRPSGAFVNGAGASTSGPLPFMDIYDQMCKTISSAGGRRGAQMATFDVGHPDVEAFITAKREHGRLRQFNLSLLITDHFVEAVKADRDWPLAFPATPEEVENDEVEILYRRWPVIEESYTVDENGNVACRVYKTIKAKRLWDRIMSSTYDFADPGFILIDRVNLNNNNWFCEEITATNP